MPKAKEVTVIRVFLDYPTSRIMIHADHDCTYFDRPLLPNHRLVRLNDRTISQELQSLQSKRYKFASNAEFNILWLEADFADLDFEVALVAHIRKLLAKNYKPFSSAQVQFHCQ